jgi:hypothetical protein
MFTPMGNICRTTPLPVPLDPYEALPPGVHRPWFAQSTCNWINFLCTEGQIPDKEVAPAEHADWDDVVAWATGCIACAQAKALACSAMLPMRGKDATLACLSEAIADGNFCLDELKRRR